MIEFKHNQLVHSDSFIVKKTIARYILRNSKYFEQRRMLAASHCGTHSEVVSLW
ncbi:MAG: hypothetical protein SNI70_09950 [Rikenellaceae bacterium]